MSDSALRVFDVPLQSDRGVVHFRLSADAAAAAPSVAQILAAIDAEQALQEGARVAFGFSVLTVVREADGRLFVHEPDFAGDALLQLNGDVTRSVTVLADQSSCVSELGVEPLPVAFDHKVVIARGCLSAHRIYLERMAKDDEDETDSGWFVGFVDGEGDNSDFEHVFCFQLLALRPALVPLLLLPEGHVAVFMGGDLQSLVAPDTSA